MGLFSTIFGKSPKPQKSESGNHAYDYLMGEYSPMVSGGNAAYGTINSLLGVGGGGTGGTPGDATGGFNNFLNSSAYDFINKEGMRGITNAFAGRGDLRSGAAGKAYQDRSSNLAKTYFDNYLNHLAQQAQLGLGAGGLISNAGQYSTGTGGTAGTGGALGAVASILPFIPGL